MSITQLLASIAIIAAMVGMLGPRVALAKKRIVFKAESIWRQHNERLDYLSSGALEDPKAHHTTDRDVDGSLAYFTTLDLTRESIWIGK